MSYPDTRGDWQRWEQECEDIEPKAYGAPVLPKEVWLEERDVLNARYDKRFESTADLDMRDRYMPDEDYYRDYFEESGY